MFNVLEYNLNAQNAVEAPRFQTRHLISSFDNHAWNRGDLILDERMPPVTTGEIYWGAVPFVLIQCLAVALVIGFPALVMHYKGAAGQIDPSKIQIEIPQLDMPPPPLDFGPPARP